MENGRGKSPYDPKLLTASLLIGEFLRADVLRRPARAPCPGEAARKPGWGGWVKEAAWRPNSLISPDIQALPSRRG